MAFFELGGMTLKSLFSKPETVCYPLEEKPKPAGLKGHIDIDVSKCILCSACQRSCPTGSIEVDRNEGKWAINHFSCVTCFECVRACPKDALTMAPTYEKPATKITVDSYDVPKPERKKKAASTTE
jgi:ech hydrogenase subunit F